jgi:hypothetical protein
MSTRRVARVVVAVALLAAGCGGGSGGSQDAGVGEDAPAGQDAAADASLAATCAAHCQGCPDQYQDTDCANYCGAWNELAGAASCQSQWQAGWACIAAAARCVELTICSYDDGGSGGCSSSFFGECEPAGDSFANCVEAFCHTNEQTCQEIATRYGLTY